MWARSGRLCRQKTGLQCVLPRPFCCFPKTATWAGVHRESQEAASPPTPPRHTAAAHDVPRGRAGFREKTGVRVVHRSCHVSPRQV